MISMVHGLGSATALRSLRHGAMTVLDIGGSDLDFDQPARGIGGDVTLAALHALGGIEAAWPAAFGRARALAVDDRGRRLRVTAMRERANSAALICAHRPRSRQR